MLNPGIEIRSQTDKTTGVGIKNQGFYLMRSNRQIARAITLGLYTRNAHYNFLRGEISFPACLDRFFGIQTNKSRYSLKDGLKDRIKEAMKGVISQMDDEYWAENSRLKNSLNKHNIRESEEVAAEASTFMRSPKMNISEDAVNKYEKRPARSSRKRDRQGKVE